MQLPVRHISVGELARDKQIELARLVRIYPDNIIAESFQERLLIQLDPKIVTAAEQLGRLRFNFEQRFPFERREIIDHRKVVQFERATYYIREGCVPFPQVL